MNGVVISAAAQQKMSGDPHHFPPPPPRPFSQTLPHNKYHFSPSQNPAPVTYHHNHHHHHQPSYHPPSTVYAQSKVASVQPTHLYNRSYASPLRSSPPALQTVATIKAVSMVSGVKNGNRTPSPTHPANDVQLRRVNGVAGPSPASSSARRNAMYLQTSTAVKGTGQQPYYQQQLPPTANHQQQQQTAGSDHRSYAAKPAEASLRQPPMSCQHRSLSPQDISLGYDDPPSRSSPAPSSSNGKHAKPPLPPALADGLCPAPPGAGPRPPPRTRPKSWTSSLFNVMRNNHSSVTFQCVVEEQAGAGATSGPAEKADVPRPKDASELAMPLTAASASDGQKFYSLPRSGNEAVGQAKLGSAKTRSRTPSPFRTIIKGLVKGEKRWRRFKVAPRRLSATGSLNRLTPT
jgi:hypothetical protein